MGWSSQTNVFDLGKVSSSCSRCGSKTRNIRQSYKWLPKTAGSDVEVPGRHHAVLLNTLQCRFLGWNRKSNDKNLTPAFATFEHADARNLWSAKAGRVLMVVALFATEMEFVFCLHFYLSWTKAIHFSSTMLVSFSLRRCESSYRNLLLDTRSSIANLNVTLRCMVTPVPRRSIPTDGRSFLDLVPRPIAQSFQC